MEFNEDKSIFLQIADIICDQILSGKRSANEKIPSVRDLGMMLQVNPNTVLRSYEFLQNKGVIGMRRGMGYYIEPDGPEKVIAFKREEFIDSFLPKFFKAITLLKISSEEINKLFKDYKYEETA